MTPLRGILLKILAVAIFTVMASLIKATSGEVPPGEAMFFRSVFAIPVLLAWLAWRGDLPGGLRTEVPFGHFLRGIAGSSAMLLRFFSLGVLALPEVTALGFTSPLILVLLAVLMLGERVGPFRIMTVALGFLGVLVILAPNLDLGAGRSGLELLAAGAVLGSALLAAFAQVFVRRLVATEGTAAIVFYFSMTTATLSLLTLPFGWSMPSGWALSLLILSGVLGGFGQIMLTASYRFAEASVLAPFDYVAMILAILIGLFIFGEVPTAWTLTGSAIVILAGIVIILRERHLGLARGKARSQMPR